MATLTRDATVALGLSQVGVAESPSGSNRVLYSTWYGLVGPWCAMFLSWVLANARNTSGYRFASTASSVAWARRAGRLRPIAEAQPGDVMVRLYTATTGHTGMATARPAGGRLRTVEGNTSGSDDRDGGSVQHRDRALTWWHYCIRLDYPPTSAPAPPPAARPVLEEEPVFIVHRIVPGEPVAVGFLLLGSGKVPIPPGTDVDALKAAGVKELKLSAALVDLIPSAG
jgi:hypothetical protein